MSCSKKAEEWEQRQKDAGEEMAAIAKAKEILTEGVKVFLQVKSTLDDDDSNVRNQVRLLLKTVSVWSFEIAFKLPRCGEKSTGFVRKFQSFSAVYCLCCKQL